MERNARGQERAVSYDLYELTEVKADGDDGLSRVMGIFQRVGFNIHIGILIHVVGRLQPSNSDAVTLQETTEDDEWSGIE